MAEPVREFVLAQPADRDALQQRLRAWLLRWAAGLQPLPQPAAVAPELPLIHAQLAAAPSHPQAAADALALAVALRSYWDHDTLPLRLQQALEQALAHLPAQAADTALRADMHELLAYQRFGAGFAEPARAHAEAALALAGSQPARRARALVRRAWIEVAAGRAGDRAGPQHAQVRAQLEEALRLGRACGDRDAQARALHQLGVLTGHLHASPEGADPAAAEALFAQSQALWEALGDRRRALARLRNRAQCWRQLGRAEDAMAAYRLCESAAQAEGDWIGQIDSLISMAELLVQQRQWQAALQANQRALALCWQRWFRHGLAYALWNPPRVLARLRQPAAALQVMAFASVFWTSQFGPLGAEDERHIRRLRRLVAWQTGPAQAEALWQQGQALDVASAVQLVLAAG
jgi:tetratricopeptide (TPR) repeat protein